MDDLIGCLFYLIVIAIIIGVCVACPPLGIAILVLAVLGII